MQVFRLSYGVRGFERLAAYALRWSRMIGHTAKDRTRLLVFWEKHGLEATRSHASAAAREFFHLVRRVFPMPFTYVLTDNGSEF